MMVVCTLSTLPLPCCGANFAGCPHTHIRMHAHIHTRSTGLLYAWVHFLCLHTNRTAVSVHAVAGQVEGALCCSFGAGTDVAVSTSMLCCCAWACCGQLAAGLTAAWNQAVLCICLRGLFDLGCCWCFARQERTAAPCWCFVPPSMSRSVSMARLRFTHRPFARILANSLLPRAGAAGTAGCFQVVGSRSVCTYMCDLKVQDFVACTVDVCATDAACRSVGRA
jgi:hypothetical protein